MIEDGTQFRRDAFSRLMQSFFIKEQGTILTMVHKLLAERFYPELENNFNATINLAADTLYIAIANANGDYSRVSAVNSPGGELGAPMGGFDFSSVGTMVLKAFLGALANVVDPTWKTPWWRPGPLTPIGMAAKALDAPKKSPSSTPQNLPARHACTDLIEEQGSFITYGPLLSGEPATEPEPSPENDSNTD
jgi:hypothetical protein